MTKDYDAYLARKLTTVPATGLDRVPDLGAHLFPFQADLVRWALRRGRAAIFAFTGAGKSRMQIEWSRCVYAATERDVLILAPLAVAAQTVAEGAAIGVDITHARDGADVRPGINITNYERLHRFDPNRFGAIVLDESGCIKNNDTRTFKTLCEAFAQTPFKLCLTATPSPNDYVELGTHAEFLGVRSQTEMLAEYFVHDGGSTQDWRLKGHARREFWRWVANWGALVRAPSDLGYSDADYELPPLRIHHHRVASGMAEARERGLLFPLEATTLQERRGARKASVDARVSACAEIVNSTDDTWLVWCDLNAESEMLTKTIRGAVEVRGSDDPDDKESRLLAFANGPTRALVSKSSIAGFGLNLQRCHKMAFVGVTDSFEAYFQAVRRCWRFGQRHPVDVHIFASDAEGSIIANLQRKEEAARVMAEELSRETRGAVMAEVRGLVRETNEYQPRVARLPSWLTSEEHQQ